MAVGYVLFGWLVGIMAGALASFGLGTSILAAFGICVGTSVLAAFCAILYAAWRTGCFEPDHQGDPILVR